MKRGELSLLETADSAHWGRKRGTFIGSWMYRNWTLLWCTNTHEPSASLTEHCRTAQEWGSKNFTDGGQPVTYSQLELLNINSHLSKTHSTGLPHDWITHRMLSLQNWDTFGTKATQQYFTFDSSLHEIGQHRLCSM